MEFDELIYRRFKYLYSQIGDTNIIKFKDIVTENVPKEDLVDLLYKNMNEQKISFEDIWKTAELSYFMSTWMEFYTYPKFSMNFKRIRKKLHDAYPDDPYKVYILNIHKKPKIHMIVEMPISAKKNELRAAVYEGYRNSAFILPEYGFVFLDINNNHDNFVDLISKILNVELSSIKINALKLKKFYENNRFLVKLSVSANSQITGFEGLDRIVFEGNDVKLGLEGLHKRQDIRVHLDGIGPKLAIFSKNLKIKRGNKVMISTLNGINELSLLL